MMKGFVDHTFMIESGVFKFVLGCNVVKLNILACDCSEPKNDRSTAVVTLRNVRQFKIANI